LQQVIQQQMQDHAAAIGDARSFASASSRCCRASGVRCTSDSGADAGTRSSTRQHQRPRKRPPAHTRYDVKKAFGAIARIHSVRSEVTERQQQRLAAFMRRYIARTTRSKDYTTEHRPHLADPRVVNGFRPLLKESSTRSWSTARKARACGTSTATSTSMRSTASA
jgi:hypothetical protein